MKYDHFERFIEGYKKGPLPGAEAQDLMSPIIKGKIRDRSYSLDKARHSGVMVLMTLHNGKAVLIMIKRVNKGVHGGQISFPGGEKDVSDIDLQHTAERETFEEVGVKSDSDKIIGPLSSLYIPPSNFFVQPFAACIPNEENYTINRSEVDQLLLIGIDDIDSNLRYSQHIIKRGDEIITAPCFEYQDQIIWGASAMILNEWLEIYNRV